MEDFNADNAKIDGAIKAQADGLAAEVSARTALAALTAKKGNCRIETPQAFFVGEAYVSLYKTQKTPRSGTFAYIYASLKLVVLLSSLYDSSL